MINVPHGYGAGVITLCAALSDMRVRPGEPQRASKNGEEMAYNKEHKRS
jgi:hypothetical protein